MVDRTPIDATQSIADNTTTANTTYIGFAQSGKLETENAWFIMKIIFDSNGNFTRILNSGGILAQNQKWTDRTTLTYK